MRRRPQQHRCGGAAAGQPVHRDQMAGHFLARRLDGLGDEPRPGVPRTITDAQVEEVVAAPWKRPPRAPPTGPSGSWPARWGSRGRACTDLLTALVARSWLICFARDWRWAGFVLVDDEDGGRVGATTSLRDLRGLAVAGVGAVRPADDPVLPWIVVDEVGERIGAVDDFLRHFLACGNSLASCRSYGYDLLRWLRFLAAVDVSWDRAQRAEVRDFVLWLRTSPNPARDRRRPDARPGRVGERAHRQAVLEGRVRAGDDQPCGGGRWRPSTATTPRAGWGRRVAGAAAVPDGRRLNAHHDPLEPFRLHRRGAYRQKQPDRPPRAVAR